MMVALTIAGSDSGGVEAVARAIRRHGIVPLVVDPVMVARLVDGSAHP